jgi:hypothetical protein
VDCKLVLLSDEKLISLQQAPHYQVLSFNKAKQKNETDVYFVCVTKAHLEAYTSSNVSQKDTISRSYRPLMTLARETDKDEKTATSDQLSTMPEAPGAL